MTNLDELIEAVKERAAEAYYNGHSTDNLATEFISLLRSYKEGMKGMVMVPVEPTEAMLSSYRNEQAAIANDIYIKGLDWAQRNLSGNAQVIRLHKAMLSTTEGKGDENI